MVAPTLTDFDPAVFTADEVAGTPRILDADVTFSAPDSNFAGGTLVVTGLLPEDRVWLASNGNLFIVDNVIIYDPLGIGGSSGSAVLVGFASGGSGSTFTIDLMPDATAAIVELLIESLTYANASGTPTEHRNFGINVIDSSGQDLGVVFSPAPNPMDGYLNQIARPMLADIDADGDLDVIVGDMFGPLTFYENVGSSTSPTFVQGGSGGDPFAGISLPGYTAPAFTDVDNDGDLDGVIGSADGIVYLRNDGTATDPVFSRVSDAENPFADLSDDTYTSPTFVDLDGDGDLDLFVSGYDANRDVFGRYYRAEAGGYTEVTGAQNPFDGIAQAVLSTFQFADLDGDSDYDLIVGGGPSLLYYENTGTASSAQFILRTGADSPFDWSWSTTMPAFGDLDDDGDLDLLVGTAMGYFIYANAGMTISVTVSAPAGPTDGDDTLTGDGTGETLEGLDGDDAIDGAGGDDLLDGGAGTDELIGGDGNDYLKGGDGDDVLRGGLGNDTYVVDSIDDAVDEIGGDGIDLVHSRVSWTLGADFENLTLGAAGGAIDGWGNELDNVITGNASANMLRGEDGADTVYGMGGHDSLYGDDGEDTLDGGGGDDMLAGGRDADTLVGGAGNDLLNGGSGADHMTGGAGNDTYMVDDEDDVVVELAGEGVDTIETAGNFLLQTTPNVENLTLAGSGDVIGAGSDGANVIIGNDGANALYGGLGDDTLIGGYGNDTLIGGAGADKMTGDLDADLFRWDAFAEIDGDRILDLNFADGDRLDFSAIDFNTVLAGDQSLAFVDRFTKVAGQAMMTYAANANLTYVRFDLDGDGKHDAQLTLVGDFRATTGNLYTGAGDTDGGWVL